MTLGPLTERETTVVLLSADGHRAESVANQLDISIDTVKRHLRNVMLKLHVNSTVEIVSWYYKTHWTPKRDERSELLVRMDALERALGLR